MLYFSYQRKGIFALNLRSILRGEDAASRKAHNIYLFAILTLIGCAIGCLTLLLSACAYEPLHSGLVLLSYFKHPLLLFLNLLPAVLLVWLFALLFSRAWAGVLCGGGLCLVLALVNYYKIMLRGDPFLAADIFLARSAAGIMSRYSFTITREVVFSLLAFALAVGFSVFLMKTYRRGPKLRFLGAALCFTLLVSLTNFVYANDKIYAKTANNEHIRIWSETEVYISRGFLLPFLHTFPDILPTPPEGYDKADAAAMLAQHQDADIPEGQKVTVMGVMLEAFADLTKLSPTLAASEGVQEVYAPWHALEQQSLHGELLTNIFAGGTVESEWNFLTGASQFDTFRSPTASYVRYFSDQGYTTHFTHPGYDWFYNRRNVNEYLGFDESYFTEDGFGELVDPVTAAWHSDRELVDVLLDDLRARNGAPHFSFAVSYQNHGPYDATPASLEAVTAESGLSEESRNILNHYLTGVNETIGEYTRLVRELEESETPVVLVLFGDHKPWLGNENSVYLELGVSFDTSSLEGMRNYHGTPWLIWANSAAKDILDGDFSGEGGTFSPCFLMPRLFDECSWEGSGFMQLAREMRDLSPLLHTSGYFMKDGAIVTALPDEEQDFYRRFVCAQYYREKCSMR